MKIVSDVLLLSYLDKFGLRVTVEAGQALAVLYSEARLYKGTRNKENIKQLSFIIFGCFSFFPSFYLHVHVQARIFFYLW